MNFDENNASGEPSDHPEQLKVETDGSSPPKNIRRDGHTEHAKPKRRGRRGKKRKQRSTSGGAAEAPCSSEQHEECVSDHPADCEKHSRGWDSDEEDIEDEDFEFLGNVMIRPINVPKAPENSTQFIIDDHDAYPLYMSFETPNPGYLLSSHHNLVEGPIVEPDGHDAAYCDIDFKYESPHDVYYEECQFAEFYNNSRFEEMLHHSKSDLIAGIKNYENQFKELNEQVENEDANLILERLQAHFLELQEQHKSLRESNETLLKQLKEAGVETQLFEKDIESDQLSSSFEDQVPANKDGISCEENNGNLINAEHQDLEERVKDPSLDEDHLNDLSIHDDEMEHQSAEDQSTENVMEENMDLKDDAFEECVENLPENVNIEQHFHGGMENMNSSCYSSIRETDSISPYSKELVDKRDSEHLSKTSSQKPESESLCHMSCLDASNKENTCLGDGTFEERIVSPRCTPRHESCHPDSCSEHIPVKEKAILRDSEAQQCEEIPLNSVSD